MATTTKTKKATKPLITPTQELCDQLITRCEEMSYCVPSNVEAIKEYALKVTFSRNTRDGNWWEGKLYKNGTAILQVENRGDGGCNFYNGVKDNTSWGKDLREFEEASKNAYPNEQYIQDEIAISFLDIINSL